MVQIWHRDRPGAKKHIRRARMWVKGKQWRREERNMITIVSGGWIYHLESDKKKGIKQPVSPGVGGIVNSPSPVEAARQARRRGKRVGTGRLAGRRMTIYQVEENLRVWVGSDGLVYRTEGRRPEYQGRFAWEMRNLRRNVPLPDSLFRPPPGYKVEAAVMIPLDALNAPRP